MCGALKLEDELGPHCGRCDKLIGDIGAELTAEFGTRDNVV